MGYITEHKRLAKPKNANTFYRKFISEDILDLLEKSSSVEADDGSFTFNLPLDIVPASRPRLGRGIAYTAEPYNSFKKVLSEFFASTLGDYLLTSFHDVPLRLELVVGYKIPKSYSKKKRADLLGQYKITTPDCDNVVKCVEDALEQSGIIGNDSTIAIVTVTKLWAEDYSSTIKVNKLQRLPTTGDTYDH
jgi:Holliday junction resolvase RusA-like endonuclease